MMRSLFSGVSALRNHQVSMDVIGNNIANVNTVGFKRSTVRFQDVLSQTMQDPSAPQGTRGGTNPMQVGLGMSVGSIDTIHTMGSLQRTGANTDMAIQGDGFFIVNDGGRSYYTRSGLFTLDGDGSLVHKANGMKVMGYGWDGTQYADSLSSIQVQLGARAGAKATDAVKVEGNLDPNLTDAPLTIEVFDSQGDKHDIRLQLVKSGDNQWSWEARSNVVQAGAVANDVVVGSGTINFDVAGENPTGAVLNLSGLQFGTSVASQDISLDLSRVTQYVEESELVVKTQDGYAASTLATFGIDSKGVITGQYSSGRTEILGRLATALFSNPGGLVKAGESMYEESNNSGMPAIGEPDAGGRGKIISQNLEMSNVDLSEEFTNMIVTQRGFQANSRIITTSDEMLQELVNLKR